MTSSSKTNLGSPRRKTLKRLFGLSRNHCAFGNCDSPIIDRDSGVVLGKVAHIRARSMRGPRYDKMQSAEERHGFSNLILLCDPHHAIVDSVDNVASYPVPLLESMKREHEAGAGPAASDDVLEDASEGLLQAYLEATINITQSGPQSKTLVFTGPTTVGMDSNEVVAIFHRLYEANTPRLVDEAARTAEERATELALKITKTMVEKELYSALRDPDYLNAVTEALRAAARRGGTELFEMLAGLLADRAQAAVDKNEFEGIILNESIEATAKMTSRHFDVLSLVFQVSQNDPRTLPACRDYIETYLCPFMDPLDIHSRAHFKHIQYCGCGTITMARKSLREHVFSALDAASIPHDLAEIHPQLPALEAWWESTVASYFLFSSVGVAVALANIQRRGIPASHLGDWLSALG